MVRGPATKRRRFRRAHFSHAYLSINHTPSSSPSLCLASSTPVISVTWLVYTIELVDAVIDLSRDGSCATTAEGKKGGNRLQLEIRVVSLLIRF